MSQVTYTLRRPYRKTEYGGVSKTIVYRVGSNGEVSMVRPTLIEPTLSGKHGYMTWKLSPGKYVVVYVERPNSTQKPFLIEFYCLEVENGEVVRNVRVSAMYVSKPTEWEIMSEARHVALYCIGKLPW
jgi:hypothetical protein